MPGFFVGVIFLCFEPLVAPLLFLIFAWATTDVFRSDVGWDWTGQWWVWVLVAALTVFVLTYRDVRLSTNAGVILGVFEIGVFLALAIWMILSNGIPWGVFNPTNAEAGTFNGIFKGMVFSILAFIGFEAAAPLGEEAKDRATRSRVQSSGRASRSGSSTSSARYAWVAGTGFDKFDGGHARAGQSVAPPGGDLLGQRLGADLPGDHQLGAGELERRRERREPRHLRDGAQRHPPPRVRAARIPVHKTPHVAIIAQTVSASSSRC